MKKLFLSFVVLCLFGCGNAVVEESVEMEELLVDSEVVQAVGVGAVCGGGDKVKCAAKLVCAYEVYALDAVGVCVDPVVDKERVCSQEQAVVCGVKGRRKNGYLNICEAERHGAAFLGSGFCVVDATVARNCDAGIRGIGSCDVFFEGVEYDGERCVKRGVFGCDKEVPFETLEACWGRCEIREERAESREQ